MADILLGHAPVCAVEVDGYCQQVLSARQKDGSLPWFPIFGDVQQFDGKPWRGRVDVVSGGFPCQDISVAGKGAGIDGERSGMWAHMARIIGEVRPRYAFIENSPMLTSRGLDRVLADLAALGFDAEWGTLSAADVGAPHKRDRIWILARNMGDTYNDGQAATKVSSSSFERGDTRASRQEQASQFARPSKQYGEVADTSKLQRDGGDHHAGIGLERKSFSKSGDGRWAQAVANPNGTKRTRLPSRADEEKPVIRVGGQSQIGVDRRQELGNPNSKRRQELDASRITESEIWFSWRFNGDRRTKRDRL